MASNEVKVQQTGSGQLTITLPRAIAESKGWLKGTKLVFEDENGETVIRRKQ